MILVLLVSNGLVGVNFAIQEILELGLPTTIYVSDWKNQSRKAFSKNGVAFALQKFFWLGQQPSIESIVKQSPHARLEKGEPKFSEETVLVSLGWPEYIPSKFYDKFKLAVNVHPALLPKYKGWNPIKRAYDAGEDGGVTIHKLSPNFDSGKILLQEKVLFKGKNLLHCYIDSMRIAGKLVVKLLKGYK